ncbi:putative aspartate-semialdehyde dehydrogenase [Lyophyllum shimeji]|uniref:aspartate-semialdehyde dehydrogenase n=1 Tax=Lyophyllum shimeji TaxID=47721 RepID=A0A9P3PDZ3_LYOSH|nr:putative aspartate-semialdehyde dehydrogenase [Lyophyllum shimeji]
MVSIARTAVLSSARPKALRFPRPNADLIEITCAQLYLSRRKTDLKLFLAQSSARQVPSPHHARRRLDQGRCLGGYRNGRPALHHPPGGPSMTTRLPAVAKDIVVQECKPEFFADCAIVFSGLDADVAGEIEAAFRAADLAVFSNAKNYRRDPLVPLIVPYVNSSHLAIVPQQQAAHSPPLKKGFIVTNANCSTTGCVIPLSALEKAFGPIDTLLITTMQAISGAGYPGVPGLDILDNVVPHIGGEEEKMEWEMLKILGGIVKQDDGSRAFDMHARTPLRVSASCNRVPVIDGHTACVSIRFARRPPPSPQQVREALASFTCDAQTLGCPSAPRHIISVHEEADRPQPRLDRYHQDGAGVSVGRIRQCPVLDIKFVVLSNNVSIGAATSSIINAELAVLKGIYDEHESLRKASSEYLAIHRGRYGPAGRSRTLYIQMIQWSRVTLDS